MIDFDGKDLIFHPPRSKSQEVKLELGGRWDKQLAAWRLPPIALNVLHLQDLYGEGMINASPQEVKDLAEQPWGFRGFDDEERARAEAHPSWETLYPFQQEGVEYLFCNPHGAGLVVLSWGLGKAAVSTVTADLLEAERVLILAPLTLAPAWKDELEKWSDHERPIKRATANDREPGETGVTIANHEVIQEVVLRDENRKVFQPDWVTNAKRVKEWIDAGPTRELPSGKTEAIRKRIPRVRRDYLAVDWDLIIVDESVMLKNRRAVKAEVLAQLRKASDPFVFFLSGSPTTKYRDDLYRQLSILLPRAFPSYWRFADFFCVVDTSGWGWTIEGDRPDRDPHHYLRDLVWVKSQDEAMIDIPEYLEKHIPVEALPQQQKALDQMLEDWIVELEEAPDEKVVADTWLARSTRLQQITSNLCSLPKPSGGFFAPASAKEDLLEQLIESGEIEFPLLTWSWFVETTHSIEARLEKLGLNVASVVGKDKRDAKDERLANFKAGKLDALVLQMSTGKFGHTFTDTRTVYYHDRSFDSDAVVQSLHRVRRIGLKHKPLLIVPKIKGSADELIEANLEGKLESIARMSNASLARLLKSLR